MGTFARRKDGTRVRVQASGHKDSAATNEYKSASETESENIYARSEDLSALESDNSSVSETEVEDEEAEKYFEEEQQGDKATRTNPPSNAKNYADVTQYNFELFWSIAEKKLGLKRIESDRSNRKYKHPFKYILDLDIGQNEPGYAVTRYYAINYLNRKKQVYHRAFEPFTEAWEKRVEDVRKKRKAALKRAMEARLRKQRKVKKSAAPQAASSTTPVAGSTQAASASSTPAASPTPGASTPPAASPTQAASASGSPAASPTQAAEQEAGSVMDKFLQQVRETRQKSVSQLEERKEKIKAEVLKMMQAIEGLNAQAKAIDIQISKLKAFNIVI